MTTVELSAGPGDVLTVRLDDHEERLRRMEATLRALARLPHAADAQFGTNTDTKLLAPLATPKVVPWPAARPAASPPPDPDAARFVTLGRALAGTAHDLNNLLAVIQGYAELLLEGLAGDPRRDEVVSIHAAAELAGGVVRHLLGVARPTAGSPPRTEVGPHLVRLERLLRAVTAGGAGVRLRVDHAGGAAAAGLAAAELTQIVLNLAVNARDAMPDGGDLVVRTVVWQGDAGTPGWPAGLPAGDWVEVGVRDTGHGLDPAVRDRLTDPHASTKPAGGLGLMTVGDILGRCGGLLRMDAASGGGTDVRVFLPRA